jgi:N-glycosylase/DNA lyase
MDALHECAICLPGGWGEPWELGSAAFWAAAAARARPADPALGSSLREELAACLLGGYRVSGPVGVAAFQTLRRSGLLDVMPAPTQESVESLLAAPLPDPHVGGARYPFPRQRAQRICAALAALTSWECDGWSPDLTGDVALRDRLQTLTGVGPKTASWVVRNVRGSDSVAIIDIHVLRAGVAASVFCPGWRLPTDYHLFESAFLAWARRGGVRTSSLDVTIWGVLAGGRRRLLVTRPAAVLASVGRWEREKRPARPGSRRSLPMASAAAP